MSGRGEALMETTVALVGLPATTVEKKPQLEKVANKKIKEGIRKVTTDVDLDHLTMEVATDNTTKEGLSFGAVYVQNREEAQVLQREVISTSLDKKNTMYYMQFQQALNIKQLSAEQQLDEMVKSGRREFSHPDDVTSIDRTHTRDWMKDPSQREMFLVRAKNDTLVYMFDSATSEAVLVCDGAQARAEKKVNLVSSEPVSWTFGEARFSPSGSYLTTTHTQGARIWAGADFMPVSRLTHRNVAKLLFSKDEKYVVTWNGMKTGSEAFRVHSVTTGEVIKGFPCPERNPNNHDDWPYFVWSHDSKYLACACDKGVSVYELPSVTPLVYHDAVKGPIKYLPFEKAQFAWQPNDNVNESPVLSLWMPAPSEASPCRLTMLKVPSMQILTTRNLFSVDCQGRIFWQARGDYCALLTQVVKRLQGKRKALQTQVEIFRMREKDLPVDSLITDEEILNIFFSDSKDRFAALSARKMHFYAINQKGVELMSTVEIPREINCVRWSPLASHFVMGSCGCNDGTGILWFGQTVDNEAQKTYAVEITHKDEMNKLTNINWDPSGRFVTTSVSIPLDSTCGYKLAGSAGYTVWSFQGRTLFNKDCPDLHSFQWRPHPPTNVTPKKRQEVKSRLKDYSKKLDTVDAVKKAQRKAELSASKTRIRAEFEERTAKAYEWLHTQPGWPEWQKLWEQFQSEDKFEEIVVETEEEISVSVKPTNVTKPSTGPAN